MAEDLIPIVMFISLAVVLIFLFWFRWRARDAMQQTIRMALDKGHELTPEIIDRLGGPNPGKYKDLRLGVIWLAIALGLALLAFGVGNFATEALQGTLATAALPFAIGLGYLLLYWLTGKDDKE
jgi:UDP-N-acetylmuramyl pentapeptide phosphotransferase/UDP-N-acetylglucosamine-1-phosphate transferase